MVVPAFDPALLRLDSAALLKELSAAVAQQTSSSEPCAYVEIKVDWSVEACGDDVGILRVDRIKRFRPTAHALSSRPGLLRWQCLLPGAAGR